MYIEKRAGAEMGFTMAFSGGSPPPLLELVRIVDRALKGALGRVLKDLPPPTLQRHAERGLQPAIKHRSFPYLRRDFDPRCGLMMKHTVP